MTKETQGMDFSKVGSTAMLAAAETLSEGVSEDRHHQIMWLYNKLRKEGLTHFSGVSLLVSWSDAETLRRLSTIPERVRVAIGHIPPQAAIVQKHDVAAITDILKKAHTFANTPGMLEAWARRPHNPTVIPTALRDKNPRISK